MHTTCGNGTEASAASGDALLETTSHVCGAGPWRVSRGYSENSAHTKAWQAGREHVLQRLTEYIADDTQGKEYLLGLRVVDIVAAQHIERGVGWLVSVGMR